MQRKNKSFTLPTLRESAIGLAGIAGTVGAGYYLSNNALRSGSLINLDIGDGIGPKDNIPLPPTVSSIGLDPIEQIEKSFKYMEPPPNYDDLIVPDYRIVNLPSITVTPAEEVYANQLDRRLINILSQYTGGHLGFNQRIEPRIPQIAARRFPNVISNFAPQYR